MAEPPTLSVAVQPAVAPRAAPAGAAPGATQNLQVAVRCRPMSASEKKARRAQILSTSKNAVTVECANAATKKSHTKTYSYDKVFSTHATQDHVFDSLVAPVIDEVLTGFNCTIFAYGQTGTGKTHTMEGSLDPSSPDMGVVPRSVQAIFAALACKDADFDVRCSFLELYNEELQDLLVGDSTKGGPDKPTGKAAAKGALRLCDNAKTGVVCQNLLEATCPTLEDVFALLRRGSHNRATAATKCNEKSSRSHSIFTIKVCVKECTPDGRDVIVNGQLNLVDLAGSECVGRSGAQGGRAREAGSINQSLLTLGRVINGLVACDSYIPYRDSKLTRLLQESLGGRTKTTIIATVSPSSQNVDETLSTLQYALRARSIQNKPEINVKSHGRAVLKEHAEQLDDLQRMLRMQRLKQGGILIENDRWDQLQESLASQAQQLEEAEGALGEAREECAAAKDRQQKEKEAHAATAAVLSTTRVELAETKVVVAETKLELGATRAVVESEVVTEAALTGEAALVDASLLASVGDLDGYRGKVGRLTVHGDARAVLASKHANATVAKIDGLSGAVAALRGAADAHAGAAKHQLGALADAATAGAAAVLSACNAGLEGATAASKAAADASADATAALAEGVDGAAGNCSATARAIAADVASWAALVQAAAVEAAAVMEAHDAALREAAAGLEAHAANAAARVAALDAQVAALAVARAENDERVAAQRAQAEAAAAAARAFAAAEAEAGEAAAAALAERFKASLACLASDRAAAAAAHAASAGAALAALGDAQEGGRAAVAGALAAVEADVPAWQAAALGADRVAHAELGAALSGSAAALAAQAPLLAAAAADSAAAAAATGAAVGDAAVAVRGAADAAALAARGLAGAHAAAAADAAARAASTAAAGAAAAAASDGAVSAGASGVVAEVDGAQAALWECHSTTDALVDGLRTELEAYIASATEPCPVTGATPTKRAFARVANGFSSTRPHEEIMAEYKQSPYANTPQKEKPPAAAEPAEGENGAAEGASAVEMEACDAAAGTALPPPPPVAAAAEGEAAAPAAAAAAEDAAPEADEAAVEDEAAATKKKLNTLKVTQLRSMLTKRSLVATGNKADLVGRLSKHATEAKGLKRRKSMAAGAGAGGPVVVENPLVALQPNVM